jgi:hypothetical protein
VDGAYAALNGPGLNHIAIATIDLGSRQMAHCEGGCALECQSAHGPPRGPSGALRLTALERLQADWNRRHQPPFRSRLCSSEHFSQPSSKKLTGTDSSQAENALRRAEGPMMA